MEKRITSLISAGEHREALGVLAEAYSVKVARFCAGLVGTHAQGEELMQEAFIDAWQAMPRFRGDSTARAWLFGIARRVCIRHLRQRDRRAALRARHSPLGQGPRVARMNGTEAAGGEDIGDHLADRAAMHEALVGLNPDLREAVLLQYQAGLDGLELAAALGVKPATARKRVSLGLQTLRLALRPRLMAPPKPPAARPGEVSHSEAAAGPGEASPGGTEAGAKPGGPGAVSLTLVNGSKGDSGPEGTSQENDNDGHELPTPASADLRTP